MANDIASKARALAEGFEAVKVSLRQTKDGEVISFAVDPVLMPDGLRRAFVGTRFQLAAVEIGDDELPVDRQQEKNQAITAAAALCRNEKFWKWLSFETVGDISTEEEAAEALRQILGIESRRELASDRSARDEFLNIRDRFIADYKAGKIK